ncbi:hypothetical protein ABXM33_06015 [Enterococcus faecalis]|uniref:hypothetical protein n=1 Tax=Enterococcus faecalis TaxID=1351 RepID=UPI00338E2935
MSMFYNSQGEFQWVSVTALISLIGVVVTVLSTIYTNKKTIRANTQTKTTIEWISEIRELSAELISNYELIQSYSRYSYSFKIESLITNELEKVRANNKSRKSYDEKYNECVWRIHFLSNQLSLYLIDDSKHHKINELLVELRQEIADIADYSRIKIERDKSHSYYQAQIDGQIVLTNKLKDTVDEFRRNIAIYLKEEWKAVHSIK